MFKKIVLFLISITPLLCNGNNDWTWTHHVRFNDILRVTNHHKKTLFFEKDRIKPFTQLVFSWNALRPDHGYFSFYVQVRNAETQRWGVWHYMADWGVDIQQSYLSKSDGSSTFVHVRLEMEDKKLADAFRIKIVSNKNAPLSLLHSYTIAVSDFNLFKSEHIVSDALQSVYIEGLPLIAQFALEHEDNSRICSPVSCTMVIDFLTSTNQNPLDFALKSFDTGLNAYGSWPYNIAHAFNCCGGKVTFFVRRMNFFADIHRQLMEGMPVIVSVRGTLPGALKSFPHGHLIVVAGWDNETREVLCHDPAAENHETVFKRYPIAPFLQAWERSHRLAYIAQP